MRMNRGWGGSCFDQTNESVRFAMSSAKQGLLLGSVQLVLLGIYFGHVQYEDKSHDVKTIWPSKYYQNFAN